MQVPVEMRHPDPLPLTWEPAAMLATLWLMLTALSLPAGQGLSFLLTGDGFQWPEGHVVESIAGLAQGHPGSGLRHRGAAAPPALLVYACVAILWMALTVGLGLFVFAMRHAVGAPSQSGLAGRREVSAVLGRAALRSRTRIVRPDIAQRHRFWGRGSR